MSDEKSDDIDVKMYATFCVDCGREFQTRRVRRSREYSLTMTCDTFSLSSISDLNAFISLVSIC